MRVEIRLTKEDKRMLDMCCEATGQSKSEIVREGIYMIYKKLNISEAK